MVTLTPPGTPPARHGRANVLLAVVTLFVLAAIWVTTLSRIAFERADMMAGERQRNGDLAIAHEEQVLRLLKSLDHVLLTARSDFTRTGQLPDLEGTLARAGIARAHVANMGFVDAQGEPRALLAPFPSASMAERDHFMGQRVVTTDALFVGRAVRSRLTGDWVLPMSRRIAAADGSFAGTVFISVNPNVFTAFYDKLDLAEGAVVTLLGLDGYTRVRRSGATLSYDNLIPAQQLVRDLSINPTGSTVTAPAFDPVSRFVSYRKLPEYPLVAVVASSVQAALAPFEQRRTSYLLGASFASVLTGLLAWALWRGRLRQEKLLALHQASEDRFRTLAELSADWYWETDAEHRFTLMSDGVRRGTPFVQDDYVGRRRWEQVGFEVDAEALAAHRKVLDRHEPFHDFESRRRDASGRLQYALVSGVPLFDAKGVFQGYRGVGHRVTERREAEAAERAAVEALRERERFAQATLDALMSHICVVDRAGRIIAINASWRAFGVESDSPLIGMPEGENYLDVCASAAAGHVPEAGHFLAGLRETLAGARMVFTLEYPCPGADGPRWFLVRATRFDIDGAVFVVVAHLDVTERRRAESELAASQARLAAIIDSAMDAIITVDDRFHVLVFNAAAAAMFRCDPKDAIGQPVSRFVPARFAGVHDSHMARFAGTGDTRRSMGRPGEVWGLRSDGTEFPLEASISRVQVNGQAFASVILRDITERVQATAALRESTEHYRLLFESSMDGVLLGTPDGAIESANAAACAMFGMTEAQLRAVGTAGIVDREGPRLAQMVQDSRSQGGRATGQIGAIRGDGSGFECELSYSVYTDDAGRARSHVVLRDVSDRVAAEAARRGLESQLREAQKMEAMGTLAGGVAHDFNNILAAILGNTALAQKESHVDVRLQRRLDEINRAGLRARGLVQQILTFSRRQPQVFLTQPLQPVVQETLQLLKSTLPAGVEIEQRLDAAPLKVHADAGQIGQVLLNLCTNAWYAMDGTRPGRIEIALERVVLDGDVTALAGGLSAGVYARLSVSDNGCGMDEATLARIYEPFFTTKPTGEGTGLGLAVVHGIVQAHHGAVSVSSRLGHGTRFDVHLPLVTVEDDAPADAGGRAPVTGPAEPALVGRGRHVAYIDDYEAMAFLITEVLQELGYRVSTFERADDGLAAVRANPNDFDIVVTDFNMPGRSGLDLARELHALRPSLAVVITTGFITEALQDGAKEAGVKLVLDKQNLVDELPGHIQRVLDGSVENA